MSWKLIQDMWAKDTEDDPKAKGKKGKRDKGKKRGRDAGDDEENDAGGDDEAAAAIDPTDNPFSDISKWTSSGISKFGAASGEKSTKKRKTK